MSSHILWPEFALPPINLYTAPLLAPVATRTREDAAAKTVQQKAPVGLLNTKSH